MYNMFEKMEKDGIARKTDEFYMHGNAGLPIYEINPSIKKQLIHAMRRTFNVEYDRKYRCYVVFYDNNFVGCMA